MEKSGASEHGRDAAGVDEATLQALSVAQLVKLRSDLDRLIETKRETERAQLVREMEERAKELGLTLHDLISRPDVNSVSGRSQKPRRPKEGTEPKYCHPSDPRLVWAGKGRKPTWLKEHLEAGGSLTDLRSQDS